MHGFGIEQDHFSLGIYRITHIETKSKRQKFRREQAKCDPGVIHKSALDMAVCGVEDKLTALGCRHCHHLVTLVAQVQTRLRFNDTKKKKDQINALKRAGVTLKHIIREIA